MAMDHAFFSEVTVVMTSCGSREKTDRAFGNRSYGSGQSSRRGSIASGEYELVPRDGNREKARLRSAEDVMSQAHLPFEAFEDQLGLDLDVTEGTGQQQESLAVERQAQTLTVLGRFAPRHRAVVGLRCGQEKGAERLAISRERPPAQAAVVACDQAALRRTFVFTVGCDGFLHFHGSGQPRSTRITALRDTDPVPKNEPAAKVCRAVHEDDSARCDQQEAHSQDFPSDTPVPVRNHGSEGCQQDQKPQGRSGRV